MTLVDKVMLLMIVLDTVVGICYLFTPLKWKAVYWLSCAVANFAIWKA